MNSSIGPQSSNVNTNNLSQSGIQSNNKKELSSLKSYPEHKPKNLNDIMKQDPSTRGGIFNKTFERKCQVELKIVEKSIIDMVGQVPISNEKL
jgi:hypothetical protein